MSTINTDIEILTQNVMFLGRFDETDQESGHLVAQTEDACVYASHEPCETGDLLIFDLGRNAAALKEMIEANDAFELVPDSYVNNIVVRIVG